MSETFTREEQATMSYTIWNHHTPGKAPSNAGHADTLAAAVETSRAIVRRGPSLTRIIIVTMEGDRTTQYFSTRYTGNNQYVEKGE
jgi:hypothetical protein